MDHVTRSVIRYLNKKLIRYYDVFFFFITMVLVEDYKSTTVFGSDDILVDEEIYRILNEVKIIEDAFVVKDK